MPSSGDTARSTYAPARSKTGWERPVNPYVAGNSVGGTSAFVGREDVLRTVVSALAQAGNQGIVLYGQRRIGKTSILQQLVATLRQRSGHRAVYFDLQDNAAKSLNEVLEELAFAIAESLGLVEPIPGTDIGSWFRDTWIPSILDGPSESASLVLLFDEFDVLANVEAKHAAAAFFPYLRTILEKYAPRLRAVFVVGRNIDDLENVAHALFKGFLSHEVSLLSRRDAEMLIRLSETNGSLKWTDGAILNAWELTHGHPLLLQALCGNVWVDAQIERGPEDAVPVVTPQKVTDAVEQTLSASRPAFEWLWKGLPPGKRVVASALAHAGSGAISEEALHRLLKESGVRVIIGELRDAPLVLIQWGLLEEPSPGQYQFRVELLRRLIERYKPLAQAYQELDKIEPTADLLYRAAESFFLAGNLTSAMERLKEALGLNPNHGQASERLAEILISQQDWSGARAVLDRLYENRPAAARPRLVQTLLAQAEAEPGEDHQLELYQRVQELDDNPIATAAVRQVWKRRGDRARGDGNLEEALAAYRRADLTDLEAEVARELRERQAAAMKHEVQRLDQQGFPWEALQLARTMTETFADVPDWLPDLGAFERKAANAALAEARRLEQEEAYAGALTNLRRAAELSDDEELRADLARLEQLVELDALYWSGVEAMSGGDEQAAKHKLLEVVARRVDYRDAVSRLCTVVTGLDPWALKREIDAEREARATAAGLHIAGPLQPRAPRRRSQARATAADVGKQTAESANIPPRRSQARATAADVGKQTAESANIPPRRSRARATAAGLHIAGAICANIFILVVLAAIFDWRLHDWLEDVWDFSPPYIRLNTPIKLSLMVMGFLLFCIFLAHMLISIRRASAIWGRAVTVVLSPLLVFPGTSLFMMLLLWRETNRRLRQAGLKSTLGFLGSVPDTIRRDSTHSLW